MYLFSGKIFCLNCRKNYRGLQTQKKNSYLCSTCSRDSKSCSRYIIYEDYLIYTIKKHINFSKIDDVKLLDYIRRVERKDRSYKIIYKDLTESIVNENNEYGVKLKF